MKDLLISTQPLREPILAKNIPDARPLSFPETMPSRDSSSISNDPLELSRKNSSGSENSEYTWVA